MLKSPSKRLLAVVIAQALFASGVALAAPDDGQQEQSRATTGIQSVSEERAPKQSESKGEAVELQAVIITAQRREEDLQEVPISVNVIEPELVKEQNLRDVESLQSVEPSLTVQNFAGTQRVTIRGQGGLSPANSPAVVAYFNEVPVPLSGGPMAGGMLPGGYYDLGNIQILKGPQGTLFGRNTTGGAVLFTTQRPTEEFGGYIDQTFGNYNERATEFALNVPFNDRLLVRLAGRKQKRDGYTRTLGTPSRPHGLDLDNVDDWSGRLSVTLKPVDGVQNDTIFERYVSNTNHVSGRLGYVDAEGSLPFMFPNVDFDDLVAQQEALGDRTQLPINVDPFNKSSRTSLSNITSFEFGDNLTLRNVFGYVRTSTSLVADADGTPVEIYEFPDSYPQPTKRTQLTEELQLLGDSLDGKLEWVVGGFMLHQPKSDTESMTYSVFGGSPFGSELESSSVTGSDSRALYAQGTYDMSSWVNNLKLTAGVRKTWDERFGMNLPEEDVCVTEPENGSCFKKEDSKNWTLAATYTPTKNQTYYVSARRGNRSGGINSVAADVPGLPGTYPAELVTAHELGYKARGRFAGMSGRMSVAAFHQNYDNIHSSRTAVLPDMSTRVITSGGASAELWGIDFSGSISPVNRLQLGAAFQWLNLNYVHFDSNLSAEDVAMIKSGSLKYRPQFKYDVFARYSIPLDNMMGDLSLYAAWAHETRSGFNNPAGKPFDPFTMGESFGRLNLSASWNNIAFKPIDLSLYVTNATNELSRVGALTVAEQMGFSTYRYMPPRMFGVSVRYRFGD